MARTEFNIRFFRLIAALVVVGAASLGQAQNWNVASGNWNVASNWNPAIVPNGEYPTISNGGTCIIAASDGEVGGSTVDVGPGTIVMTGGSLTYPQSGGIPLVATIGSSTGGLFTQSGGISYPYTPYSTTWGGWPLQIGATAGTYGEYDLSGGSLGATSFTWVVSRGQTLSMVLVSSRKPADRSVPMRCPTAGPSRPLPSSWVATAIPLPASAAVLPKTPPTASTTFRVA